MRSDRTPGLIVPRTSAAQPEIKSVEIVDIDLKIGFSLSGGSASAHVRTPGIACEQADRRSRQVDLYSESEEIGTRSPQRLADVRSQSQSDFLSGMSFCTWSVGISPAECRKHRHRKNL